MSKLLEQELLPWYKAPGSLWVLLVPGLLQDFAGIYYCVYITLPRHYLLQFALLFLGLVQPLENQLPLETSVAFH